VRILFPIAVLVCAAAMLPGSEPGRDNLAQANAALQAGEADHAMELLNSLPQSAEVHNLKCRVQFTLGHWDAATDECQQAVNMDGGNSDFHLWLGRALGERADHASFMSAYSIGKRVGVEFEQSVQLNPRNAEALSDLGEFDSSAPGIVGGGIDKAQRVVEKLDKLDPARAEELRGRIADEQKDFDAGEKHFKQAISLSQHPAFQWMTLASFYRRRQRWNDLETAVENGFKAAQHDRRGGVALFNGASALIRSNRNPALAAKMLETYLAGTYQTEEAPTVVAHTELARLKAELGDKQGARHERDAALSLSHDYRPAQELKF
jgi:tetratricopeptide (TPR) repeat protein